MHSTKHCSCAAILPWALIVRSYKLSKIGLLVAGFKNSLKKKNEKKEVTEYEFLFVCFGLHSKYIPKVLVLQALLYCLFHSTLFLIKNPTILIILI